jgi:predicted RNA-binding Zn-ribbon protein involved in translation (DUF1610 family)
MARFCRRCGAAGEAPEDGIPPGWSLDAAEGGVHFLCADCTRSNVRSIEARLAPEWWED